MSVFNPEVKELRESNFETNKFSLEIERKLQQLLSSDQERFPEIVQCPNTACGCPVNIKRMDEEIIISCSNCGWNRVIARTDQVA